MNRSPLITLPPELRNTIYEYVLYEPSQEGIVIPAKSENRSTSDRHPMALTQVCRQLSSETLPMFFSINKFTIKARYLYGDADSHSPRHTGHVLHTCRAWLSTIGSANVKFLRSVTIDLGIYNETRSRLVQRQMIEDIKAEFQRLPLPAHALSVSFALTCPFYQMQYLEIPTCDQPSMLNALTIATQETNQDTKRNWDVIYLGHFERMISMIGVA